MHTSSHSVSPDIASVPPVISNTGYPVPIEILKGHENGVRCACFYPDENKIVSGSQDETLRIWNRKTGATQVMRGHTRWVWDVDVSQDGKMVVSGSADKTVRIWDGESGEVMHVFEGHEDEVNSVEFSRDSSRVVSGSDDHTVRVWSIETGELAFEPIECHGMVFCVRYSPSGDRIVSGGLTVQIWNGETGVGILSIRNSEVWSLAWTVDGTHLIGGGEDEVGEVTIWNSVDGGRLRKWKAHDEWIRGLSLSPTASHLATSSWREKTAFVFDTSTGKQVAALKHDNDVKAIAFSCSGRLIATGCGDSKIYLWEAPASEDPKTTSPARPFSSLLDRPAVPLAGPSRNDGRELDPFWDSLPNRAQLPQRASPQPQWVFSRIRNTFANVFTRTPAGTAQTNLVRETVEPVEVAAGRDNTFWVVVAIPTYNALERILYTIIHCRKPEDPDDDLPAVTGTNSSETSADNAATRNQSKPVGDAVICTQPQRTEMAAVVPDHISSAEQPGTALDPLSTTVGNTVTRNQHENIEMVAISRSPTPLITPPNTTVLVHAPSQSTPPTDLLPLAVASRQASSTTMAVTSAPLPRSSNNARTPSERSSSHDADVPISVIVSRDELAIIQEVRRRNAAAAFVTTPTDPLSRPEHDREFAMYPYPSTPASITRHTSPSQRPASPQPRPHPHAQPSRSLVGLDPMPNVVPPLLSPSSLRPPPWFHPPSSNVQSLESTAQLAMRQSAHDEDID